MLKTIRNSVLVLVLLGLAAPVVRAGAAPMELTASTGMMETHPVIANFIIPFFREWERMSGNTIKITYFNPGTIVATSEMVTATHKGVLSITMGSSGSGVALLPATQITSLPLLFDSSRSGAVTLAKGLEQIPQLRDEWADWKMIMSSSSVPSNLLTTTKQVRTLEDLQGMKIGTASNEGMDALRALGAMPVMLMLTDMYLAMQRGMVDGCMLPAPTFRSTKVTEVGKYLTMCNLFSSSTPMIMSKETWDSLPPQAREPIEKIGLVPLSAIAGLNPDYYAAIDTEWVVQNHNVQIYELPAEERDRWLATVATTHQSWIERAGTQGVENPEQMLEAFKAISVDCNNADTVLNILTENRELLGPLYPEREKFETLFPGKPY